MKGGPIIKTGFISAFIMTIMVFIAVIIRKGIRKANDKISDRKKETAIQEHDVKALVKNNTNLRWINYALVQQDLALHRKWLDGDSEGKQLSLYAEGIFDLAGLKGQRIEKAIFSHCLFDNTDLSETQFVDCEIEYCLFKKCKLDGTDFSNSNMIKPQYE